MHTHMHTHTHTHTHAAKSVGRAAVVRTLTANTARGRVLCCGWGQVATLLASSKGLQDSPYHHRHTPLARSQAEKEALETAFPGLKGRVLLAAAGDAPCTPVGAARIAGGMGACIAGPVRTVSDMAPESPGDILVRNLDTGEQLPAKQVLSRLSLHDKLSAKPSGVGVLSQLGGLGPQQLRRQGLLPSCPYVSVHVSMHATGSGRRGAAPGDGIAAALDAGPRCCAAQVASGQCATAHCH